MVDRVQFIAALSRYKTNKLGRVAKIAQQKFYGRLAERIVRTCPVRTGHTKANMRVAVGNTVGAGVLRGRDPSGNATLAQMRAVIDRSAANSMLTFYNNVPWMSRLENGWSRQAPLGVFRIAVQSVMAARSELVRSIQRELGAQFIVR